MALTIEAIRAAVRVGRWALSAHARRGAEQRNIGDEELVACLAGGEILEDYPSDPRGASALVLGRAGTGRPLHAVCGIDPIGTVVCITVYEPAMPWWRDERTRNR